jgi:hypothetical protein
MTINPAATLVAYSSATKKKEVNILNKTQHKEVVKALTDFVLRVSKGDATKEEVALLPEVAAIVLSLSTKA